MPASNSTDSLFSGGATVAAAGLDDSHTRRSCTDPVEVFLMRLEEGALWHRALLEAMGHWTLPVEYWNERRYKYIVGQEAFDWLLLAERISAEAADSIPSEELEMLLFHGILPEPMEQDEFRSLIGSSKYQGYLNFHYGVVLEEALQLAAEENTRKRHIARGYTDCEELVEDAFRHLYNDARTNLLEEYRRHSEIEGRQGFSITDLKEFTYWLHKRRVNYWDPARVASDTRLAIRRYTSLKETAWALRRSQ